MQFVRSSARLLDRLISSASLAVLQDRPGLIVFMLHGLFLDREEPYNGNMLPLQPFTVDDLDALVGYFSGAGYRFVSPTDILSGLDPSGRHALITFDDGYASNLRALPVLRRRNAPATFFVSTDHVANSKSYWWDAHYRARFRLGMAPEEIAVEQESLKRLPFSDIEVQITDAFGVGAFTPVNDSDRPMTEAELTTFSADPLVTIGNHTVNHAILTACSHADAEAQIRDCQVYLANLIGEAPSIIAYPNGNHSDAVVQLAKAAGLQLGVTVEPRAARPHKGTEDRMRMGRYYVEGGPSLMSQCRRCRSPIQLLNTIRRLKEAVRA